MIFGKFWIFKFYLEFSAEISAIYAVSKQIIFKFDGGISTKLFQGYKFLQRHRRLPLRRHQNF